MRKYHTIWLHLRWPVIILLCTAALFIASYFERLELLTQDARFLLRGYTTATSEVVVVGITQQCIKNIGDPPWKRSVYAEAINHLKSAGAELICLDIFFPDPSSPPEDEALVRAVRQSGNVILPVFSPYALRHSDDPVRRVAALRENFPSLTRAAFSIGHINVPPSIDGKCRSIPLAISHKDSVYYNIGIEAAQRYLHRKHHKTAAGHLPLTPNGDLLINYYGQHITFDFWPFHKILKGEYPENLFEGKLVLVGQTSLGQINADLISTPLGVTYGVLAQGTIMDNILTGDFLKRQKLGDTLVVLFLLSAVSGLAFSLLSPVRSLFAWLAGCLLLMTVSFFLFTHCSFLLEVVPGLAILTANFTIALVASLRTSQAALRKGEKDFQTLHKSSLLSAEALKPENAPQTFVTLIGQTVGADLTTLSLKDQPGQWHFNSQNGRFIKSTLPIENVSTFEQQAADNLYKNKSAILSPNVARDPNLSQFSAPAGAFLSVPLIVRDQIIGRVNCYNKKRSVLIGSKLFRERDMELANVLAQQTALLLDNGRLINQLEGRNEQLQTAMHSLKSTQDELIQKEKLSAVGEMASMIIHDMRSPLTAVLGYAGMIQEMELSKDELQEFTTTIADQVNRINQMAQQILDFSRGNSTLNKTPLNTDILIGELMQQLQTEFRQQKDLTITCDITTHQPINIDKEKMLRALLNLARNAAEALENDGKITISCRTGERGIELIVTDNGKGIPEAIRHKLFQPFATYGKAKGTGLGLAIVKKTVRDHGGHIRVESEEGKGATFIINLPAAE